MCPLSGQIVTIEDNKAILTGKGRVVKGQNLVTAVGADAYTLHPGR